MFVTAGASSATNYVQIGYHLPGFDEETATCHQCFAAGIVGCDRHDDRLYALY